MLNKEEIEKIKKGLREELSKTIIINECGLSTNDFSENIEILEGTLKYIEQLETNNKKLIEKLEEKHTKAKTEYSNTLSPYQYGRLDVIEEILEIAKGENNVR